MRDFPSRSKIPAAIICAAIGLAATSVQYIHQGYLGVVDGSSPLRLLDHGPHFRAPWQHVVQYPIRSGSFAITTTVEGPIWTLRAEITLVMSVCRDSVLSLHEAYGGDYVESLVVPRVNEFFRLRGDALGRRGEDSSFSEVTKEITAYLNTSLASSGVNVYTVWLRSYEVSTNSLD